MSVVSKNLVGKQESVSEELLMLNEHQTPLLSLLGFADPVTQVEHQWFEDKLFADESVTTASALSTDTAIVVADAEAFRAGHIVKINEELVKVTAVAGSTLTVERAYADTTAAAVASGDKVEVQFVEGEEGADARNARFKPRQRVSNLTQIFDETISISGTAAAVSQYGIDDLYSHEQAKKQLELALQLEKAAINGVKFESADGLVRQMGGMRQFITTNVIDAAGAALTDEKLNDAMQAVYEKGGFNAGGQYKIMVGAKQKRTISNFAKSEIRLDRQDNGRGQVVDFYVSDFGAAEVVLNNNLKADEVLIVDANRVQIKPLQGRNFTHEYLGKTGDHYTGQIVGEHTIQFVQEAAHARIKNLV